MCSQIPSMNNFVIWISRILNLEIAVVDYFNFFLFLYFQWLVSLCRKMGLVYIRQVHVIGTILRMEVVQSDGKTKLCTVLCQFLDWPFKNIQDNHTQLTYYALLLLIKTHTFFAFNKRQKNYSIPILWKYFFLLIGLKRFLTLPEFDNNKISCKS